MFGIPEWAIGVGFIILAGSVGRALLGRLLPADQFPRRKASKRELAQTFEDVQRRLGELEDVPRRLAEVESVQRRLAEVEERLDFAERLLAQQRDVGRVAPPKT